MRFRFTALIFLALSIPTFAFAQETPQEALDNGNVAQAQSLLQAMSADSDDEKAVSGLCGLAQIEMANGNFSKSEEKLTEALEKSKNLDKKKGWHVVIAWLQAENARRQNDLASCKQYLQNMREHLEIASKISPAWQGALEYTLSLVEEDNAAAREAAENAIQALNNTKFKLERGHAYLRLAELEWARDKQRRAFKNYDDAIHDFRTDATPDAMRLVAETLILIAEKKLETDDAKGAKARLDIAQKEIEELGNPEDLIRKMKEIESKLP